MVTSIMVVLIYFFFAVNVLDDIVNLQESLRCCSVKQHKFLPVKFLAREPLNISIIFWLQCWGRGAFKWDTVWVRVPGFCFVFLNHPSISFITQPLLIGCFCWYFNVKLAPKWLNHESREKFCGKISILVHWSTNARCLCHWQILLSYPVFTS